MEYIPEEFARTLQYKEALAAGTQSALPWHELVKIDPCVDRHVRTLLGVCRSSLQQFEDAPGVGTSLCVDVSIAECADALIALRRRETITDARKRKLFDKLQSAKAQEDKPKRRRKRSACAGTAEQEPGLEQDAEV